MDNPTLLILAASVTADLRAAGKIAGAASTNEGIYMAKFKKFIGAILGAITGGVVIAIFGAMGVDIDPGLAATIAGLAASVGALLAPKNAV